MIKSILGGKSKNLFDISKVVTSNVVKRNGNSLICSSYGTSIGTLGSICPTLKLSDTITISFKCASEGVASNFMSISNTSGGLKIFTSGETFPVSEVGLSSTWYLYSTDFEHRDIPNKTTYSDIQVELGSTATEYVPHELTSYKSIMKVSDVCQLGDKRKYNPTETNSGVTFTNNGDGTITVNGTSTQLVGFYLQGINFIENHTYLLIGCPSGGSNSTYILDTGADIGNDRGNGTISKPRLIGNRYFAIYVYANTTCNNLVFKPQLFDLTEMFGAGNEPKTVAEFKAKFPNDYYPYSPSCFVTSFDERMPCKTKNLFDKNNAQIINGYISGSNVFSESSFDKTIIVPCLPNTTYTFSKISVSPVACDRLRIGDYTAIPTIGDTINNVVNIGEPPTQNYITITTSDTAKYIVVTIGLFNYTVITTLDYILSTCQLEKGTTATDYVPYGYV